MPWEWSKRWLTRTLFSTSCSIKGAGERGDGEETGDEDMGAVRRESSVEAEISGYNALGSRQALFIMGWTRVLEASGGSGPPKAQVLRAPIGTDGVNRRAVSLRSLFAHEPRVVFRDNKRATSSFAGTTTLRSFSLSSSFPLYNSLSLYHLFWLSLFSAFFSHNHALIRLVRLTRYHLRCIVQYPRVYFFTSKAVIFQNWNTWLLNVE